jgi:catalase
LKIFKTNYFAQAEERYRSLDKTGQEHMIDNLMADLSHVTIPAIQRHAIENLRQADETLAASVAKGLGL